MTGNGDPHDPWAPPERREPQDRGVPPVPGVHDQPTMPGGPGVHLPPPPPAPGGPAQPPPVPGMYGYPAVPPGHAGYPGYAGYAPYGWQQAPSNGLGIAALVLGILGVVLFCLWGLGIVLGVLALIFGIIGRGKARRGEADNHGMALAGIILGSIAIVVGGVVLALMITEVTQERDGSPSRDEGTFNTVLVAQPRA
ncbi:DUF4190 domain-containing protein [Streptomyces sp. NPDC015131]|uniref:DUF4190 domain-containing protein n=1 Tax=Streptomyces sp. NPDC015131 TaxID=3364941 RepID=UPI0036FFE05C